MGFFDKLKKKKKAYAVFEGGGVKGLGIAGALEVAERYYEWENVAGTSAGAIIGALVAAGYSASEIKDMLFSINYKQLKDPFPAGKIPPVGGPIYNVITRMGIYQGKFIEDWVKEKLAARGIRSFGDLINSKERDDRYKYKLQVITSDISRGRMVVLPRDLKFYGINPDEFSVARAVRMSSTIPFYFAPVVIKYHDERCVLRESYFVDGGVLSNFPLWLFESEGARPKLPTFGFRLVGPNEGRPRNIEGPVSFLAALVSTMLEAHDAYYLEERSSAKTISIPTLGIHATDFDISKEKMRQLYESGKMAAEAFFEHWNFGFYLQRFFSK
ncbi:patatin-like phospholipase family protein [Thermincola ferriacetica]